MEKQTIWQKLGSFLGKNWKTSVGALLILIATILQQAGVITPEIFGVVQTILIILGFVVAKDADKTGR